MLDTFDGVKWVIEEKDQHNIALNLWDQNNFFFEVKEPKV